MRPYRIVMATATKARPKVSARPHKAPSAKAISVDMECRSDHKVKVCLVADLTERQIAACKRLTLPKGRMRPALEGILSCKDPEVRNIHMKESLKTESVVLVTVSGKLAAWALVQCANSKIHAKAYFFVSEEHRRLGLGTLLANEVIARWPVVEFSGWDRQSLQFFLTLPLPLSIHADIRHGESQSERDWAGIIRD